MLLRDVKPLILPAGRLENRVTDGAPNEYQIPLCIFTGEAYGSCAAFLTQEVARSKLGAGAWNVWMVLRACRDRDSVTYVTRKTIGRRCHLSRSAVSAALNLLQDLGMVTFPGYREWVQVRKTHEPPWPSKTGRIYLHRRVVWGGIIKNVDGQHLVALPRKVAEAVLSRRSQGQHGRPRLRVVEGGAAARQNDPRKTGPNSSERPAPIADSERPAPNSTEVLSSSFFSEEEGRKRSSAPPISLLSEASGRQEAPVSFERRPESGWSLPAPGAKSFELDFSRGPKAPPAPPRPAVRRASRLDPAAYDRSLTALTPPPPKVKAGSSPEEQVRVLLAAYRAVHQHRMGKRCFIGLGRQKDVTRLKAYRKLVDFAGRLLAEDLAPTKWVLYSFGQWEHAVTDRCAPGLLWVFNARRLEERADVCHNTTPSWKRSFFGPLGYALFARQDALRHALTLRLREGMLTPAEEAALQEEYFPGLSFDRALAEVHEEVRAKEMEWEWEARRGEWIWG